MDVRRTLVEIFDSMVLLEEAGLHEIETACLDECIKLLGASEIKMEAQATARG